MLELTPEERTTRLLPEFLVWLRAKPAPTDKCEPIISAIREAVAAELERNAPYRELHQFILENCTCMQSGADNHPCVLNDQPDTWCLYHKADAIRLAAEGK